MSRFVSHFELECVCGAAINAPTPEGTCATCGRGYRIVWGEQDPRRLASMAEAKSAQFATCGTHGAKNGASVIPRVPQP